MKLITPILPPIAGYVETIDADGNHIYAPTPETIEKQRQEKLNRDTNRSLNLFDELLDSLLGSPKSEDFKDQAAMELRKAIQIFASLLSDEEQMMSIASVYPVYEVGIAYKTRDIFSYGTNSVGDPQLYQVLQNHTSAAEWTPDTATSLYKKIGVTEEGIPEWVQPLGASDAYQTGDVVMYNGKKYESLIDGNVWSPDAYPAGWKQLES